jgi:nicotinate phosphoribosyltransferase
MVTSADRPALEVIYKLMESADETSQLTPRMKIAEEEKLTYPGAKQVFRVERGGKYQKDMLCLWEEVGEGSPRLVEIFRRGKLVYRLPTLSEIRERVREELEKLPARYKRLRAPARYPVKVSPGLKELTLRLKQTLREHTS